MDHPAFTGPAPAPPPAPPRPSGQGWPAGLRFWGALILVALCVIVIGAGLWLSYSRGDAHLVAESAALAALVVGGAAFYLRGRARHATDREQVALFEQLASHDELTGLYNYRHLREQLRAAIDAARKERTPLTLVLLDLDNFTEINERFGHLAGDHMLAAIAAAMRDAIGGRGVVARFGGDEFAALLPGCERAAAETVAASLVEAVSDASIQATPLNLHLRVGATYGIARFPEDGDADDALIAHADSALHDAKADAVAVNARTAERHAQDVFFTIGEAMGLSLDAQETLDNIVRAVGAALDLDACAIRLLGDDDRTLIRAGYAADTQQRRVYRAMESEQPATREELLRAGLLAPSAVYIDDIAACETLMERYRRMIGPGTWLLNLPVPGRREGILTLTARHDRTTPPPMDLANAIARLVSAALRNCDVYEAAKRQGDQLTRLAGVGALLFGDGDFEDRLGALASAIAPVFDVDSLTIDTIDPEGAQPFRRNFYARPAAGASPESVAELRRTWRNMRPQLTDPETARFLAAVTGPLVIEDAPENTLVPESARAIARETGTQTVAIVPIVWQGRLHGLAYFGSSRVHAFSEQDVAMMASVAAQIAPSLQIASLHVELKRSYDELKDAHLEAILRLAYAAEARDPYTGRHLHRIKAFTAVLGRQMGLNDEQLEALGYGAVVHDLGKLRIPDSILIKAGELSDDEWKIMKRHPEYGAEFLGTSPFYDVARQVAMYHHERWNGSGYPHGLKGEEIPLAARIVSVADVYDALTSDRPYKVAWPPERALAELIQMRGKTLCPHSVDAFLRLWNDGVIAEIERESGHASFEFDFRERYAA
ncbi:MAG: diguanylate cyclase domain-containing protein [Dehalococcoidia bacterium]